MPWTEAAILYRQLLKNAKQFPSYMYRTYALRRIRDGFRDNRHQNDPVRIKDLLDEGRQSLQMIQRQVIIGKMYATSQPTVIESLQNRKP
jgi:hypothetical protein